MKLSVSHRQLSTAVAVVIAVHAAGCQRYWVCDDVDPSRTAEAPRRLSETGLYTSITTGELAPGVLAYTPRFELWSDGAEKRRWILLPDAQQIDTSNMDDWVFPQGTKVWKQFSVGGARVETRLLEKNGPKDTDWRSLAYVWQPDEGDALAAPLGEIDSNGSEHDVPAAAECSACHGGRRSFILGFSAIQLASSALEGELALDGLVEQGRLSSPPAGAFVVPGTGVEVEALGYLHANCSHCHNQTRPERAGARCFDPNTSQDFTLSVAQLDDVAATPTYRTAVDHVVKRGDPEGSKLFDLVGSRGMFQQMPPLATEQVDASALANLRLWIKAL